MSLDPNQTQRKPRTLPEIGIQSARCYAIIDCGKIYKEFNGAKQEYPTPTVLLCFELTKYMTTFDEKDGPVPFTIQQEFAFSASSKAKLPKVLKSWGRLTKPVTTINLKPYLGKYCVVNIEHTESKKNPGEMFAKISGNGLGISPWDKERATPAVHYKDIYFDLDQFSWEVFKTLPQKAQKLIKSSEDWPLILKKNPEPVSQGNTSPIESFDAHQSVEDDDIPF